MGFFVMKKKRQKGFKEKYLELQKSWSNNNPAFEKFLLQYESVIQRKAKGSSFPSPLFSEAADVAQELRIRLWKFYNSHLALYDEEPPRGYVMNCIRQGLWEIDHYRQVKDVERTSLFPRRRVITATALDEKAKASGRSDDDGPMFENLGDKKSAIRVLFLKIDTRKALETLTSEERFIVNLSRAGYCLDEIAEIVGIENDKADGKLTRAREKLKHFLPFAPKKKIKPEEWKGREEKILKLKDEGKCLLKISNLVGVSKSRVFQIIKKNNEKKISSQEGTK